ncbi:hypothetical protein [Brevibacillus sp. 179-C9.3 HS]|uniref:hypothetical protein n=1 Tax=unclassified Brevibacillus TaxID=2684853 RepID=UPI00399FC176
MDLHKNLQSNHTNVDEEGQAVQKLQDTKISRNEDQHVESWGWSNNTETIRDH